MSPDKRSKKARKPKSRQSAAEPRLGSPPKLENSTWVVAWHPKADAELRAVKDKKEQVAMRHAAEKLEVAGPFLGAPHQKQVMGKDGKGFRELRPRRGKSRWRPVYRRIGDVFVILAVAPEAEVDGVGFKAGVRRAKARFDKLDG